MSVKISSTAFRALKWALNEYYNETMPNAMARADFCASGVRTWSIDFCAPGHMTPQKAYSFARDLQHAADLTEHLNSMRLEVLEEESTYITSPEIWDKVVGDMKKGIADHGTGLATILAEIHFEEEYVRMWGESR